MTTIVRSLELRMLSMIGAVLLLCAPCAVMAADTDQTVEAQRTYDQAKEKKAALEKQAGLMENFLSKGQQVSQKIMETVNGLNELMPGLPSVSKWEELDAFSRKNFDGQGIMRVLKTLSDETAALLAAPPPNALLESAKAMSERTAAIAPHTSQLESTMGMTADAVKTRLEKDRPGLTSAIGKDPAEVNVFLLQVKIRYIISEVEPFLEKLKGLDRGFSQMTQKAADELRAIREDMGKTEAQLHYLRRNHPVKEQ
jgi:hypothetical protein